MAASESEESHRAVGEFLLPSPSPFVTPPSLPIFAHHWVSQYGPAVLPPQALAPGGVSFVGLVA